MIWFPFDMDAWSRRTKEMDHAERGIYVTLLAWYYGTGGPLPLDWRQLYRIAEAQTDADRTGLKHVLEIAFDCRETGWHNLRADEEVTRYVRNAVTGEGNVTSVTGISLKASRVTRVHELKAGAKRQKVFRERKLALIGALRQVGADCSEKMTMAELKKLSTTFAIEGVISNAFATVKVTTEARSHSNSALVVSSERAREEGKPEGVAEVAPTVESPTAELCRRVKQQGIFGLYASKPELVKLLARGVTADELVATAAEAVAKGKGLPWMLATVKGRHDEADRQAQQPQEGPKSGRGDVKTNRLQAWVPELVAKPPAPDFAFYDSQVPHVPAD